MFKFLNLLIALVWLVNGLVCKLLNIVPRHKKIVANILGCEHADFFTNTIGIAEIAMAVWVLALLKPRVCAVLQIIVIGVMNIIEFIHVPHLLLFGKLNIVFASVFIALIYYNNFVLCSKQIRS